jgi:hypothetical protein
MSPTLVEGKRLEGVVNDVGSRAFTTVSLLDSGCLNVWEVVNTMLRLIPKYSIAMHGNAWHCSIAEDAKS